jgi:hypothetical protein
LCPQRYSLPQIPHGLPGHRTLTSTMSNNINIGTAALSAYTV